MHLVGKKEEDQPKKLAAPSILISDSQSEKRINLSENCFVCPGVDSSRMDDRDAGQLLVTVFCDESSYSQSVSPHLPS